MKHSLVSDVCAPNAVWVWMTLLGVYTPLASGTLRLFLAPDVTFSYAGATAHGVEDALSLREESLDPIKEHTLWWHVMDGGLDRRLKVRASFQSKGRKRSREWVDTIFTLDGEGRLTHVQQTKSYVVGEEVPSLA
jgi:hypothetical protein